MIGMTITMMIATMTTMTMMTSAMKTTRNSAETSFLLHIGRPQLTELAWTQKMLTMIMMKMMTSFHWMTTKTLKMMMVMLVVVVEKPMSSNPQSTPICQSGTHTWGFGSDGSTYHYHPPQIPPSIQLLVLVTIPVFLKYKYETPKTPFIFLQFTIYRWECNKDLPVEK